MAIFLLNFTLKKPTPKCWACLFHSKTTLEATTERKCQKAEKNASIYAPTKRHQKAEWIKKEQKPLIIPKITPNITPNIILITHNNP